ncbi:MAG: serine--tRNA ligase [Candidatus Omnitrophota bacterium]|nr:serine--tRNA ligase [Candidatus Omnitrophota bacterium]
MLDIKFIRENADVVRSALVKRNARFDFDAFLALDEKRRACIRETEQLRAQQNKLSEQVKVFLKEKKDAKSVIEESKEISRRLSGLEEELTALKKDFEWQLLNIPNVPHESVPVGDVSANVIVKNWGKPRQFDRKLLTHIELAEHLDIIDFKGSSKISGSNFILLKGLGASFERALINFMLDLHTKEHGYKEIFPPFLVNRASMTTTGQLPKFEEDMYRLKDDDCFLIPTAEVPVTNIHADEVLEEDALPVQYAAYSACFRREAGSYGKDTRGLARVHQFNKIELVKFTRREDSYLELEKLLGNACRVLEILEIPYRVVLLSTQDLSFAAAKCYDIEIYAPGIDKWLEVSSCSNFEDFQARRGNIRYRPRSAQSSPKGMEYVHTLNGSGVALPRLMIAILENYQQQDGTIIVPEALRRYFDGRESITQ